MKTIKILFLVLFASLSSYAQDPQLFENDWYLQKVIIDGQVSFPPNLVIEPQIGRLIFTEIEETIEISYCDIVNPTVNFDLIDNIFNLQDDPIILAGLCAYQENLSFALKYFSVFYNQQIAINPFSYSFTTENEILTLTVVNSLGDIAIYGNEVLSIQDSDNLSFQVYPNPVKDKLLIASKTSINDFNIFIYSIDGKLISALNDFKLNNNSIDLQKLTSGIYFIQIKNKQGQSSIQKFIKY